MTGRQFYGSASEGAEVDGPTSRREQESSEAREGKEKRRSRSCECTDGNKRLGFSVHTTETQDTGSSRTLHSAMRSSD